MKELPKLDRDVEYTLTSISPIELKKLSTNRYAQLRKVNPWLPGHQMGVTNFIGKRVVSYEELTAFFAVGITKVGYRKNKSYREILDRVVTMVTHRVHTLDACVQCNDASKLDTSHTRGRLAEAEKMLAALLELI